MTSKSTPDEIRARFDQDVERFSNLASGQSATVDAPLSLELIAQAAALTNPEATHLLDIGCGAGNYTLKVLERLPRLSISLVDLSRPMLERAKDRIAQVTSNPVTCWQSDIRDLELETERYDLILAAAVLHHLRDENEWEQVFHKIYRSLKPGGSFWVSDLVEHSLPQVQAFMWERYGRYLSELKDDTYRDQVFDYIRKEDTPRPLIFQLNLLRRSGFQQVEVLHKNNCFAAFGAVKGR
ncbi:MAG: class I SAM-dependent methyltransferase [Acidobacteriota bacterium]